MQPFGYLKWAVNGEGLEAFSVLKRRAYISKCNSKNKSANDYLNYQIEFINCDMELWFVNVQNNSLFVLEKHLYPDPEKSQT